MATIIHATFEVVAHHANLEPQRTQSSSGDLQFTQYWIRDPSDNLASLYSTFDVEFFIKYEVSVPSILIIAWANGWSAGWLDGRYKWIEYE